MAGISTAREVVSNTSPILYLDRLERLDLLQALYGRVIVPPAVLGELDAGRRKGIAVPDVETLRWIDIVEPSVACLSEVPTGLGPGETQVLALGLRRPDALVILDDKAARREAATRGIRLTGTLGVLMHGKRRGCVDRIRPYVDRLEALGFRVHPRVRAAVLRFSDEL